MPRNKGIRHKGTPLVYLRDYRAETGLSQAEFAEEVIHDWRGQMKRLHRTTLALYETQDIYASSSMGKAIAETIQKLLRRRFKGHRRLSQIIISVDDLANNPPSKVIHVEEAS